MDMDQAETLIAPIVELNSMDADASVVPMYKTRDDGRSVEFEEGVWESAEFIDVVNGYPIYARRTF